MRDRDLKNIPALRAKGLHRELLEHKGELRPSWYREAVEQELNFGNQKRWECVSNENIQALRADVGCCWVQLGDVVVFCAKRWYMLYDVCGCVLMYAHVC